MSEVELITLFIHCQNSFSFNKNSANPSNSLTIKLVAYYGSCRLLAWYTHVTAVLLSLNTSMADVTSCKNGLPVEGTIIGQELFVKEIGLFFLKELRNVLVYIRMSDLFTPTIKP